ncbi:MAG: tRNA preQ1(34) S-adenosylmethionine ribosyltransferase-isomerase QueA [Anaerolineae bacterium]|nr:tRNA preQ1(34) S-adenosylmethionine ribosyltransferase-isomerase QueA [Anaerolineae bacterium]
MKLSQFDYDLPDHYIAQTPADPRDTSRLMVLDRASGAVAHHRFFELGSFLRPNDVLVLNTTRVIPARLHAYKAGSGGKVEILLLRQIDDSQWHALVGGRNVRVGTRLRFDQVDLEVELTGASEDGERTLRFSRPLGEYLSQLGVTPLPPYISAPLTDPERYQTVYSREAGSAAAPTAGLHFTPDLLFSLKQQGIKLAHCVLHIGLDTFQPVKVETITDHRIHSERASLSPADAKVINDAKLAGGRIIAVGTTSARTLETAGILSEGGDPEHPELSPDACPWRPVTAFDADTRLFIFPGYRWRVVDGMITNFHLPRSSLLMMVSAFAGLEQVRAAYETAKREGYRFFSFGDAMLIV